MTEPFIKYILLHPTPSPQMNLVSLYLGNKLVGLVRNWQMKQEEDTSLFETSKMDVFNTCASLFYWGFDQHILFAPVVCILMYLSLSPCAGNALVSLLVRMIPLGTSQSTTDLLSLVSMATQVADITKDSDGMMVDILLSLMSELTSRGFPSIQLIESLCSLTERSDEARMLILVGIT